jgi:radical SAM protein with 4Fe4S-binding SPASM domain
MSLKFRAETFGGILALDEPPMLVHVDREFMRELGVESSPLWKDAASGPLSAPLEVHFSVTNSCSVRCRHCYMDSGDRDAGEMSGIEFRKAMDLLAEMGVFHIAMGGGEALERPDLFELAAHVRSRGMVANLTTNGLLLTRETATQCTIFGQVNVSVDRMDAPGIDGERDPAAGLRAIELLLEAGVRTGINCVITRQNVETVEEIVAYAAAHRLHDVEFLRFKPSGRGKLDYFRRRLTAAQNRELFPMIGRFAERYGVPIKIDCSFVPMFCWHRPDKELMERFSVYGCEAGNVLLGIRSDGRFGGCSFLPGNGNVFDLATLWHTSESLAQLRTWGSRAPEPCRSCRYLDTCKGGCRAVAAFVTGDSDSPDPECPFVENQEGNLALSRE